VGLNTGEDDEEIGARAHSLVGATSQSSSIPPVPRKVQISSQDKGVRSPATGVPVSVGRSLSWLNPYWGPRALALRP